VIAGIVGWFGVAWIGWTLWQGDPPRAGFDLALLLEAARRVLAGESPYDPAMLAGSAPAAVELFYSYPPPVAQAMTLLAWLPNGVVLVLWAIGATLGFGWVAARLALADRRPAPPMAVRAIAIAPLVLPFTVAILFGNLDAWYPLAYGALLLTALPGASRRTQVGGGIAVVVISIAKLQPAPLLLWIALRAVRERGGPQARVFGAAVVGGLAILGTSLLVGGIQPWIDYVQVVKVGAGAELVDPRNIGPVSLIAQATGIDGSALRWLQIAVVAGVVVVTAVAALRIGDPLLSLALAGAVSLVTLPITWYHYPAALLPVAVALAIGNRAARPWLAIAIVLADVAIAWLPIVWIAVGVVLLLAAKRRGEPRPKVQAVSREQLHPT
jgi:hypothetical protein